MNIAKSLCAALAMGALSTFGDWLWTNHLTDGALLPALGHGLVFFIALAAVLAWAAAEPGAWRRSMTVLPVAGFLIAAAFYPIAFAVGYLAALLVAWAAMWLIVAEVQRRARGRSERVGRGWLRGTIAAIGSGVAFWAISGIWTQPAPDGPDYPWHFVCWSFAFLPGFLALFVGQPQPSRGE